MPPARGIGGAGAVGSGQSGSHAEKPQLLAKCLAGRPPDQANLFHITLPTNLRTTDAPSFHVGWDPEEGCPFLH